ncbi:glutathione peroxidase [bacterium]|nr:glutathione peroxidase [bacterium]
MCAAIFVNRLQAEDEVVSNPEVNQDQSYLDYPIETIHGDTTTLRDYNGKLVVLVNVASKCGFTSQYEGLQSLYETYKEMGLVILGLPANNFMGQEPGTNQEILEFCTTEYNVTFPMMAKISVKGKDKHPLYEYLTESSPFPGEISWNFNKFLLDREGNLVARFESNDKPRGGELEGMVRQLL